MRVRVRAGCELPVIQSSGSSLSRPSRYEVCRAADRRAAARLRNDCSFVSFKMPITASEELGSRLQVLPLHHLYEVSL